jgi:hypothetical protein
MQREKALKYGTHVRSPPTSAYGMAFRPVSGLAPQTHCLPGKEPSGVWMRRLALTVAGAAQALRRLAAHLIPVYPSRRKVFMAPDDPIFKSNGFPSQGYFSIIQTDCLHSKNNAADNQRLLTLLFFPIVNILFYLIK